MTDDEFDGLEKFLRLTLKSLRGKIPESLTRQRFEKDKENILFSSATLATPDDLPFRQEL